MKQTFDPNAAAAVIVAEAFVQDIKKLEAASGMDLIRPRAFPPVVTWHAALELFSFLDPCIAQLRLSDKKRSRIYTRYLLCKKLFVRSALHRDAICHALAIAAASRAKKAQKGA